MMGWIGLISLVAGVGLLFLLPDPGSNRIQPPAGLLMLGGGAMIMLWLRLQTGWTPSDAPRSGDMGEGADDGGGD